jgi:Uma2 family endonuclease
MRTDRILPPATRPGERRAEGLAETTYTQWNSARRGDKRMTASTALTPADLLSLPDDGRIYELVHGEFVEKTFSKESSRVNFKLSRILGNYIDSSNCGWGFGPDTGFRCFQESDDPDRVRKPGVAFISLARMPAATYEDEGYISTVPDLVVEVISPNDLASEVEAKRDEWLAAGVQSVWIVDPTSKTVRIERHDGSYALYRHNDILVDEPVLPGFAVPVVDFFRKPG